MDFSWSDEQDALFERMRALGTTVMQCEPDGRMAALAAGGALGLPIATEHGGGGHELPTTVRAHEGPGRPLSDGRGAVAAGVLYPFRGILLSPMLAAAAMSLSSVSVIGNALRLRRVRL